MNDNKQLIVKNKNPLIVAIEEAQDKFLTLVDESKFKVSFENESYFARQILRKNEYIQGVAKKNIESLKSALFNCAILGVTLNPSSKLAYLVARGGEIQYDISYRGLIYLGVRDGGIISAYVDTVKEKDFFKLNGKGREPTHEYNPFEKGREGLETIGAFCVAQLPGGGVLTEVMSRAQIDQVKACSTMKDKKIWNEWGDEMDKKSVIKRAHKMWPSCPYLNKAIDLLNEDNGEGFSTANTDTKARNADLNEAIAEQKARSEQLRLEAEKKSTIPVPKQRQTVLVDDDNDTAEHFKRTIAAEQAEYSEDL